MIENKYYTVKKEPIYHKNLIDAIVYTRMNPISDDVKWKIYIFKDEFNLNFKKKTIQYDDKYNKITNKKTTKESYPIQQFYALIITKNVKDGEGRIEFIRISDDREFNYKIMFRMEHNYKCWSGCPMVRTRRIISINDIVKTLKKHYKLVKCFEGIKKCEY